MDNQGAGTEKVANCCECAPLAAFNFPIWCQDLRAPRSLSGAVESSLCPAAKQTDLVTLCCHFLFKQSCFTPWTHSPGPGKVQGCIVPTGLGDDRRRPGSPWAETNLFGFIYMPEVKAAHKMATRLWAEWWQEAEMWFIRQSYRSHLLLLDKAMSFHFISFPPMNSN